MSESGNQESESANPEDPKSKLIWIIKEARRDLYERQSQERSERKTIRLRPGEIKTIEARAELIGMTSSAYMRHISVGDRPDTEAAVTLIQRLVRRSRELLDALEAGAESAEEESKKAALEEALASAEAAFDAS